MKKYIKYFILSTLTMLFAISCTKPYAPKAINSVNNYLVVEGIINANANDTTTVNLSRTVNLTSGISTVAETGATISIQDNQNQIYNLTETTNGVYKSAALTLDNTRQYRLNIHTTDGKTYTSDYQNVVTTPAIDTVGFTVNTSGLKIGVQVYVNTHDPKNNTHYYHWDYIETWQFHSRYESEFISNGVSDVVQRPADQFIFQCWTSGLSNDILLGSSAKLSQDVIYQQPLVFIPSTSEKIETRYTILVKQYAMTEDGYNYFTELKKNTEELGSIFDAQPTQLTGNVHCTTDATLPVIGYIYAGTIQQKRIYIDNKAQLPQTWVPTYPYDCTLDTAWYVNPKPPHDNQVAEILAPQPNVYIPVFPVPNPGSLSAIPAGYSYSNIDCVDCSIRGKTTPPSFWIP